jgi:hypothetical protein
MSFENDSNTGRPNKEPKRLRAEMSLTRTFLDSNIMKLNHKIKIDIYYKTKPTT